MTPGRITAGLATSAIVALFGTATYAAHGLVRVSYDAGTDQIALLNSSACDIAGFGFVALAESEPKSAFRKKRGDPNKISDIQYQWVGGPSYEGRSRVLNIFPSHEVAKTVSPPGYRIVSFELREAIVLADDAVIAQENTPFFRGSIDPDETRWLAGVTREVWDAMNAGDDALIGDWVYDGSVATLTLEDCKND